MWKIARKRKEFALLTVCAMLAVDGSVRQAWLMAQDTPAGPPDREEMVRPAEARSRRLARTVPGYGGAAFDSAGNIVVYLTDDTNAAAVGAARSALAPVLRERIAGTRERGRLAARPEVIVRRGAYTFEQLREWRDRLEPVFRVEGVTYTDLNEAGNHLTVGIDPTVQAARGRVEALLAEAGIPGAAVRFRAQPPFVDFACYSVACAVAPFQTKTLSSMFRPIEGGVRFEGFHEAWGERKTCSLGFVAIHNGAYVFLTAAHCTGKIGTVERTPFGQPAYTDPVGVEYLDPPFGSTWATTQYGQCGSDILCRRADFALINSSSIASTSLRFGYLARPKDWAYGAYAVAPSTEIHPTIQRMRIVGEKGSPEQWEALERMGWKNGWTYGNVEEVCIDARHYESAGGPNPLNIVWRCQHILGAGSGGGDSGGPYFKWVTDASGTETAIAYGIHRAAATNGRASFSSLDLIRLDMGLQTTDRTTFRVY